MSSNNCKAFLASCPELSSLVNTKNLKRVSKKASGNTVVRVFECEELMGVDIEVSETNGSLTWRLIKANLIPDKGFLLEVNRVLMCQQMDEGRVRVNNLLGYFSYENLPQVNGEDLDFENSGLLELDDTGLVCCAGGDWQKPKTFRGVWKKGKLYCTDVRDGFEGGMGTSKMLSIVYPNGIPKQIKI